MFNNQVKLWNIDYGDLNYNNVFSSVLGFTDSPGWFQIREHLTKYFGNLAGLKSIELGCGLGKLSVILNTLGVETTLLDSNLTAIEGAKKVHEFFECNSKFIHSDALDVEHISGKFDISLSVGTAEHFTGENRRKYIFNHIRVLKPKGIAIIWAQHKYGISFNAMHFLYKKFKRIPDYPYEEQFTKREFEKFFEELKRIYDIKHNIFYATSGVSDISFLLEPITKRLKASEGEEIKEIETFSKAVLRGKIKERAMIHKKYNGLFDFLSWIIVGVVEKI